jgi:DMSO/TMAO reductase YedYZ molybdopterin-dependent catalytic subunit
MRWPRRPPPGPPDPAFWRSPLRGPWLTTALGTLLLPFLLVVAVTGFASHAAYQPDLGRNAIVDPARDLQPLIFGWPTRPTWLYAANQGLHVTAGIVAIPLLLAKLWSVIPRLFTWPPVRSPAHALERLSLLGLVGGAIFEFATGVVNAQLYYPFHFNFVVAHYYGAWVFLAALVLHVALQLPVMRRAYRDHGALRPWRDDLAHTRTEPFEPGGLVAPAPDAPTISRRGLFAMVGAAAGGLAAVTAGQAVGGPLRRLAVLAPRGGALGDGPNDFPVNKTARAARVTPAMAGPGWRLRVAGRRTVALSRQDLLALPQATAELPVACVEGWSTTQSWTGVRLRDLAAMSGLRDARAVHVASLQPRGVLRQATLGHDQLHDEQALLALRVNGADLSLDHGHPARIIVPALPGVHCTKWVASLEFVA